MTSVTLADMEAHVVFESSLKKYVEEELKKIKEKKTKAEKERSERFDRVMYGI